ncbi:MAG: cytidine deaminase [Clostridiales bacterium]|nr:cytidine deaminase [Clostridiales bacterium]
MTDAELYMVAVGAAEGAYAPYSGYRVGAALLAANGKVYTGANVENSSYGAAICAERTAAVKAVTDGQREFVSLAVAAPGSTAIAWPCGICRQFLFEFGGGLRVITGAGADSLEALTLNELLANGFRL